ncbi:MAG: putative ABC transporter permease [Mobilitalea sp.]
MLIAYNKFLKYTFLFLTGGFAYGGIEIISRGYSHISMLVGGGICFILIGLLDEIFSWDMSIISQMAISAIIITTVEFVIGIVVNIWLKLNVWDYSAKPYNILGQVCLLYTNIWFFLSLFAILMDDYLRYFLLKEEKPRYRIF